MYEIASDIADDIANGRVQFQARGKAGKTTKTFKKDKNANGVFVADVLIDLANLKSKWWTGRYNHAILSMDTCEFEQFHQEIEKRTKDMEDYGDTDQPTVDDSFTVQDDKGKEYIY